MSPELIRPLYYGSGLTLETAKKMIAAAEKESVKQGPPMVIAVADAGGNLLALHRMDNAPLVAIQISTNKAFTTVFGKMATARWRSEFTEGGLVPLFFHDRWITFPGGFPLVKDGKVVGGLGVSGGRIEDVYVARAALKAGGFDPSEAVALLAEMKKKK